MAFRVWPDTGPRDAIRYALVWRQPPGSLARLPNLKAILVLGAGVDSVLDDPELPANVPVARLVDAGLAGAMLDVFEQEPLPAAHPFWRHPKIIVTPHVAAPTLASESQAQVVENIRGLERGEMPQGLVDRAKGY